MCATLASLCSLIKWKQGSGTFRLKPSSSTHYNATIQETFPRATLHLLHRYPFIPRVLLCCVSRRRSASLASTSSEASCIGSEYHTSLTGFVGKPGLCALVSLCCFIRKGIVGDPVGVVSNCAPKAIETNYSQLFYKISLDPILITSAYPTFANLFLICRIFEWEQKIR